MKYSISSFLIIVAFIAILLQLLIVFQEMFLFYFTPLAFAAFGYLVGKQFRKPATGVAIGIAIFSTYVMSLPFVLAICNPFLISNTAYNVWRTYEKPFLDWASGVDWFLPYYEVWFDFASYRPGFALTLLALGTFSTIHSAYLLDKNFSRLKSAVNSKV